MKSAIFCTLILCYSFSGQAQGVFSNQTNEALQKVISDYPNRFGNIRGEMIAEHPQTIEYRSNVAVPGSLNCIVTKYNAVKKEIFSWKCLMYETDEFVQARNKFKELYNQLKNTIVKIDGEKPFILTGKYETPLETKKFTTIIFELLPASSEMQHLKIELSLQHYITDWQITLNVYDKQR